MSDSQGVPCPYLGSLTDPDAYWPEPSLANRCYALGSPTSIDPSEQGHLCLGGEFTTCPRWQSTRMTHGYGRPLPKPKTPLSQPALLRVIVGGTVLMALLLACAVGLVFYQVREVGDTMLTPTPTETVPPTQTPVAPPTATPAPDTPTPLPTATTTHTFTPMPTATMLPLNTPIPIATFTPIPPPPPPTVAPTFTPQPPRATSTPRPPNTRAPTYTRRPTNTRRPPNTPAPTRTFTPTRTPTAVVYALKLTASSTKSTVNAGQTTNFVATLQNIGSGPDTIDVTLAAAVMEGWNSKMYIGGADRGSGPVTLSLAKSGTKAITVQIVASAGASPGDVGEAYLSAVSKKSPTGQASISFMVTIKE